MPVLRPEGLVADAPRAQPVEATTDAQFLLADQPHPALIAIHFPKFSDGRGFTLARRLRALGYAGVLRASGHVIPDQFAFALECGFNEIDISDGQWARQPWPQWQTALAQQRVAYQPDLPTRTNILAARHAAPAEGPAKQGHLHTKSD